MSRIIIVKKESQATHAIKRLNPTKRGKRKWETILLVKAIPGVSTEEIAQYVVSMGLVTSRGIRRNQVIVTTP